MKDETETTNKTTGESGQVEPIVSNLKFNKKQKELYNNPTKTPDWWNSLYTDSFGNCYSDADSGL